MTCVTIFPRNIFGTGRTILSSSYRMLLGWFERCARGIESGSCQVGICLSARSRRCLGLGSTANRFLRRWTSPRRRWSPRRALEGPWSPWTSAIWIGWRTSNAGLRVHPHILSSTWRPWTQSWGYLGCCWAWSRSQRAPCGQQSPEECFHCGDLWSARYSTARSSQP